MGQLVSVLQVRQREERVQRGDPQLMGLHVLENGFLQMREVHPRASDHVQAYGQVPTGDFAVVDQLLDDPRESRSVGRIDLSFPDLDDDVGAPGRLPASVEGYLARKPLVGAEGDLELEQPPHVVDQVLERSDVAFLCSGQALVDVSLQQARIGDVLLQIATKLLPPGLLSRQVVETADEGQDFIDVRCAHVGRCSRKGLPSDLRC